MQIESEPRLYTIRNPDRVLVDGSVGRPVLPDISSDSSSFHNRFQVATLNEHAQMPSAVKLQVTVDVSEGDLPEVR